MLSDGRRHRNAIRPYSRRPVRCPRSRSLKRQAIAFGSAAGHRTTPRQFRFFPPEREAQTATSKDPVPPTEECGNQRATTSPLGGQNNVCDQRATTTPVIRFHLPDFGSHLDAKGIPIKNHRPPSHSPADRSDWSTQASTLGARHPRYRRWTDDRSGPRRSMPGGGRDAHSAHRSGDTPGKRRSSRASFSRRVRSRGSRQPSMKYSLRMKSRRWFKSSRQVFAILAIAVALVGLQPASSAFASTSHGALPAARPQPDWLPVEGTRSFVCGPPSTARLRHLPGLHYLPTKTRACRR